MLERTQERKPCAPFVGMKTRATIVENCMEFPEKLQIDLPYDSKNIAQKTMKSAYQKGTDPAMFIAAIFIPAQIGYQSISL